MSRSLSYIHLKTTVNFTNLKTLTINGEPTSTTITCTAGDGHSAGIVLDNITDTVTLNNLRQTFCGSRVIVNFDRIYDETYSKILSSALTIVHCHDMELEELIIERSRGNGLTIFNLQGGRVYIKSSIFIDNELPSEYINATEPVYGGSGVCILLGKFLQGQYSPMTIQFDNCTFRNNTAHTEHYNLGQTLTGYGRGGGAYVLIDSGFADVHILFLGCKFIANHAFIGGGLSINIHGRINRETSNVTVEIEDSLFKHNGCSNHSVHSGFGGGVHFAFNTFLEGTGIVNCHYLVRLSLIHI